MADISLIIDTAFETCQIALAQGGKIVVRDKAVSGGGHDRVLVGMVEKILSDQKITTKNLNNIIVTTGPGRFTGLRVGIAFARGLVLAHQTPVIGVRTTDALAVDLHNQHSDAQNAGVVVCVKRGESFVQFIRPQASDVLVIPDEEFLHVMQERQNPLLVGVLSPAIQHYGHMHAAEPSLEAIVHVAQGPQAQKGVIRPYYAA